MRLKPSPHYLLITFSPSHLTPQPPVACWQLAVPKTSHAEDSSNPNSLLLVSVTSLQAPQELHFHVWLRWTPGAAGSAGELRSLHSCFFLLFLSLPSQRMKMIPGATSAAQTRVLSFFLKNYVVDKLEETLRQVVLNGSYCGSLKCEPTENDRDTYCIHKHRLPASETKLWLRLSKDTIQREDRSCNNKHHTGRAALK